MSFRLYKEGQGRWARGSLAALLLGVGLFASVSISQWFEGNAWGTDVLFTIPFVNMAIQTQYLLSVLVLLPFLVAGFWYYNQARVSDFLIETESELMNKVTWPTGPETVKNSIVVVVTCIVILCWIAFSDFVYAWVQEFVY
ncbi:MAG: preprotein translocase subunit SecE [Planctomycetota bacterium]